MLAPMATRASGFSVDSCKAKPTDSLRLFVVVVASSCVVGVIVVGGAEGGGLEEVAAT